VWKNQSHFLNILTSCIWFLTSSLPTPDARLRGLVSLMPGGLPRRFVTVHRTVHRSHAVSADCTPKNSIHTYIGVHVLLHTCVCVCVCVGVSAD
jgi:hypothetical protein